MECSSHDLDFFLTLTPSSILIVDKNNRIVKVNANCEHVFGYDVGELQDQSLNRLLPDIYHKPHEKYIQNYMKFPYTRMRRIVDGITKTGDIVKIEVGLKPIHVEGRMYIIAIVYPILDSSASIIIENILDTSPDGIFLVDTNNIIRNVNTKGCVMIGKTRNDILTQKVTTILPSIVMASENLQVLNINENHIQVAFIPFDFDRVLHGFIIMRSINDTKEREIELLEKLNDRIALIRNINHELRNGINGITGFVTLLKDLSPTPAQTEYIANIESCTHSIEFIVNELLQYTKTEIGVKNVHPKPFFLYTLQDQIKSMAQLMLREYGKAIEFIEIRNNTGAQNIITDFQKLKQTMVNILSNAIKFTTKGAVTVEYEFANNNQQLFIIVTDTGPGIQQDNIPKVYTPFFRENKYVDGTGLGLYITKSIIDELQGSISFTTASTGTCFTIMIPSLNTDEYTRQVLTTSDSTATVDYIERVLIVEDNKINRKLLQKYLEKLKIEYETAENGLVALEILQKDARFDAIFLDLYMPVMGGIETAQRIQVDHLIQAHTRIIAITATISETDIETCYEMGIEKILKKPYSFSEIEQVCRKKQV